ncbi:concanavalin A-like lectin/glucanase superfamily protein [Motilibacter rhizosphaerae]|uniref:Concanavalin A-like lectin/glucanase superfamily protein n=1 Tax=Motilibacter rhizosphaerae TaxID=598652 RepID=A0A4Q7NNQ6_9ACTN|nr:LamG domain-containing protein [Motilibacter rhizosphaerae]RZS86865.1 concanavalin A-like lectin/glucanase superfamily protein [Motilibacter rhizosphaerae]
MSSAEGRRTRAVLCLLLALLVVPVGVARAAFRGTGTSSSTLTAASSFDDYPTAVGRQSPSLYYRQDEAASASSTSTATSSSGSSSGTYNGRTDGPSLWWKADEASGTTAYDSSGGADPGTVTGATVGATGWSGNAFSFGASSAQVVASARPAVRTDRSFSVSARIMFAGTAGTQTVVSQDGSVNSAFYLGYKAGTGWRFVLTSADTSGATLNQSLLASTAGTSSWYDLVGVYDSTAGTATVYVNGTAGGATSVPALWNATGSLEVGRSLYHGAASDPVNGKVDDIRVYNRALTPSEISAISSSTAYYGRWDFSESAGASSAADTSGNTPTIPLTLASDAGSPPAFGQGGKYGNGLALAAASQQYATSGSTPVVPANTSFTTSAWVLTNTLGSYADAVTQVADTGSYFWLTFDGTYGSYGRWVFGINSTVSTAVTATYAPASSPVNSWTFLTGTYDASTHLMKLYVGSTLVNTASVTLNYVPTTMGGLQVGRGRNAGSPTNYWPGTLDQVHVYNRALTQAEVTTLYNSGGAQGTEPVSSDVIAMAAAQTGALQGAQQGQTGSTAVAYSGTANGYDTTQVTTPSSTFSLECWFKVAPGQGGALIGYTNDKTGMSSSAWNQNLYIDTGGYVEFGVNNGASSLTIIKSDSPEADGAWHHVAATSGPAGMLLYVDGVKQAMTGPAYTTVQNYTGYWRWGGNQLSGWQNSPSNPYLVGSLDEVAVYPVQLTAQQVAWHFHANH